MINIPLRVKNLIKKYDTSDPYRIARELNIEIVFCDTPKGINGLWRRVLKRKYIVINEWQRKAVLCYELAHYRCHRGYVSYCMAGRSFFAKTSKKNQANLYAAETMAYCSDIERVYVIEFLECGWK